MFYSIEKLQKFENIQNFRSSRGGKKNSEKEKKSRITVFQKELGAKFLVDTYHV